MAWAMSLRRVVDAVGSDGPPVVALIGPTGIGKSDIAMKAAVDHGAVIVAIDAFTVYRQMTIGTAKPSLADRRRVPHRMVDVRDVEQDCSVQWFQGQARTDIADARRDGHPVLLTGGSGLYFRAVVDPLEFPPTDPAVRAGVQAVVEADVPAGYARLVASDPAAAERIDPLNVRRITRALEVAELTGRTFSSYRTAWEGHTSVYPGLRVVGLDIPQPQLVGRIQGRVKEMLAAGWLSECRALRGRELSTAAAQAIGYAELLTHLRLTEGPPDLSPDGGPDLVDPAVVTERIVIRTRRFAARQRRWFRADPRVEWTVPEAAGAALDRALTTTDGRC